MSSDDDLHRVAARVQEPVVGAVVDGRFVLESRLGHGGMGSVWLARQLPLGRPVALKLLKAEFSALPQLRRRFAREARAAARLDHVHIVSVIDFGADTSGAMYIAMELAEGPQLMEAVIQGLSVMQVLDIIVQLLSGLAHAHARGVVHRDLKPENVILAGARLPTSVGVPKIVDFGIATLANEREQTRETEQDQVVGTPLYMSPEQAAGERDLSPRTDLYNVGLMMYELLAGAHPFEDESNLRVMLKHVHEPPPPLVPRAGLEVPAALERVIMRALEKRPAQRYASAVEMRRELEPLLELAQRDPNLQRRPLESSYRSIAAITQEDKSTRPVGARSVAAPTAEASAAQLAQLSQGAPFVGRGVEREQLLRWVERALADRSGRIVWIDGEAGLGKTRLAMWLKETVEERGLMRGHIGVFTRGVAVGLRGVLEVIESIFRTRGGSREEVARRIDQRLQDWRGEMSDADRAALLDFMRPQSPAAEAGVTGGSDRLFAAIVRMLELACQERPRLLVLDDMHWAGRELADFLDYLAVELRYRPMPLILVGTARGEELAEHPLLAERLRGLSRYLGESVERLQLERMEERDEVSLLQSLLPCDPGLVKVVTERAAGNPLHLVMLLRALADEQQLEFVQGRWRAKDLGRVSEAMPPGLAELFRIRIDQVASRRGLGELLDRLLERCAVLGKRFSYHVLRAMVEVEGDEQLIAQMDRCFDVLLREEFITEVMGRGEEWYTFHHGLLRDMLERGQLGPTMRRRLHRFAAQALEQVHEANVQAVAAEIGQHWQKARELTRAVQWFWYAGQTSRRSSLQRHALSAYLTCVQLMDQLLGVEGDEGLDIYDLSRFEVAKVSRSRYLRAMVHAGDLYEGFGEFELAEQTYRRVVKLCGAPRHGMAVDVLVPLCQTWLGMGHICWQRGDLQGAQWAFDRVYKLLSRERKAADIAGSALRGMARVAWLRGAYDEATGRAEQAYDLAEQVEDLEGRAESLWIMGEVARMLADREGARAFYERSIVLYTEAKLPLGLARNLLGLAQIARYHKRFDEASERYKQALAHYDALGDRRGAGHCHNGLGEIARFEGRLEDAQRSYLRARAIWESIGAQYDVALVVVNLGLIALKRREFAEAEAHLQAALEQIEWRDYPYLVAGVEFNMALIKAMRGQDEEANRLLRQVLALNAQVPISDIDFAEPLERLGSLRAAQQNENEARVLWERAREIYQELGLREDLERVERRISLLS